MKARTLLTLGLLSVAPSLFAQIPPEPLEAVVVAPAPRAPKAARAPRATVAPVPEIAALPETASVPSSPEIAQTPKAVPAPVPAAPAAPATAPPVAPVAPIPPRPLGQMLNVQIEVTLSDSKGTPKTVALTVADGEMGQNRTNSAVQVGQRYENYSFNADGRPMISGNRIRLLLTVEANVPATPDANAGSSGQINLRQSQTLILNDGDSVEIARATDPVSARAFILSVKVKIQR